MFLSMVNGDVENDFKVTVFPRSLFRCSGVMKYGSYLFLVCIYQNLDEFKLETVIFFSKITISEDNDFLSTVRSFEHRPPGFLNRPNDFIPLILPFGSF